MLGGLSSIGEPCIGGFTEYHVYHGEDGSVVGDVRDYAVHDGDQVGVVGLKRSVGRHVLDDIVKERVHLTFLNKQQRRHDFKRPDHLVEWNLTHLAALIIRTPKKVLMIRNLKCDVQVFCS